MRPVASAVASAAASAASLQAAHSRLAGPWLPFVDHCHNASSAPVGDLEASGRRGAAKLVGRRSSPSGVPGRLALSQMRWGEQ